MICRFIFLYHIFWGVLRIREPSKEGKEVNDEKTEPEGDEADTGAGVKSGTEKEKAGKTDMPDTKTEKTEAQLARAKKKQAKIDAEKAKEEVKRRLQACIESGEKTEGVISSVCLKMKTLRPT